MWISDENQAAAQPSPAVPAPTATVVSHHEGEDGMGSRSLTVERFEELRRRLAQGRGLREIARALGCSRDTVREVRDGLRGSPAAPKVQTDPLWMQQVDWPALIHDLGLGHPLKLLWEEKAQQLTGYPNFWKQFYRKFPQYRQAAVTAREFAPGERVEVDYAADPIEWVDLKTGQIHKAWVFVAGLGFSQLLFAWAAEDMKSRNWLGCHRRMFTAYGGVTHVTVPDCLKQGVLKCHLYDPDLNPGYAQLRRLQPADRPRKYTDGRGLHLLVTPNGGKYWRFNFSFEGKQKTLAFGVYPDISLARARERLQEARTQLAEGIDPAVAKQTVGLTFEALARQWFEHWSVGRHVGHAKYVLRRLEADIFHALGARPVAEIPTSAFRDAMKKVEARGALEIAKRVLQTCGQIMRYAVANDLAPRNPVADGSPPTC